MRSFKLLENRSRYVVAAIGVVMLGVVAPIASAAQITERSVQLSSAVKEVEDVSYGFTFTADNTNAGAIVVQFCDNTPLIGQDCVAPTGFTAAGATASGGATISSTPTAPTANKVVVTKAVAVGENTFTLGDITNPDEAGALYVRIATYADATAGGSYSANGQTVGSPIDTGSVALSITDGVNVSGAVLETMVFCVSGEEIASNCIGGGDEAPELTAPTLRLGKDTAGVIALDSTDVYEGTIYTQLSTNAAKGAIIRLKSSAEGCGGLLRSSDRDACDITPAGVGGSDDVTQGEAQFGLKLGADVTDETDGKLIAFSTDYNSTNFRLKYASDNQTGVTSIYGDPILGTDGAPANNRNMPLTFGASVSNNTPAGDYSADLSLIATGKF